MSPTGLARMKRIFHLANRFLLRSYFASRSAAFSMSSAFTGLNPRSDLSFLRKAVGSYCSELKLEAKSYTQAASLRYWSLFDANYRLLIEAAVAQPQEDDESVPVGDSTPIDSPSQVSPMNKWRMICRRAAQQALAEVCPAVTPRQVQAYARAFGMLNRFTQTNGLQVESSKKGTKK